jgi:hypothetical protein
MIRREWWLLLLRGTTKLNGIVVSHDPLRSAEPNQTFCFLAGAREQQGQ